jgi:hypothetical protein
MIEDQIDPSIHIRSRPRAGLHSPKLAGLHHFRSITKLGGDQRVLGYSSTARVLSSCLATAYCTRFGGV